MISTSGAPYYDDFDENKNFVRILFRPSVAVQARELTQMQTMIQNQIGKFGSHIFSNGSKVIDAQTAFETRSTSLKITATDLDLGANITNLFQYFTIDTSIIDLNELKALVKEQGYIANRNGVVGLTFTNGNARLKVVAVYPTIDISNPATVICQEMTGVVSTNNTTYTASTGKSFTTAMTDSVNPATFYSINSGVFFVNDLFVYNESQTVVTSKYTNNPSIRVGLKIVESIVTVDTDQSLLDPAKGSTNYNAVGADRYAINLILVTKAYDAVDAISNTSGIDYIELARINDGVIAAQRESSTYSDLEDSLARRTYDESGDYTVTPFDIQFRDHPTDTTKFQVGMGNGVAYVRGYEFRTQSTTWLDVDRARTTAATNNEVISTLYGNYVTADSGSGTITGNLPVLNETTIQLWNATTGGTQIGTARVRLLYRTNATKYRIYLTDVSITSGVFGDVRSIRHTGGVRWDLELTSGVAVLNESSANVLLFKQPYPTVKQFTDTNYNYNKVSTISSGSWTGTGPYTITNVSPSAGEVFLNGDSANGYAPYIIIDSTGTVRTITNVTIGVGGTLTLTVSAGAGNPSTSTLYSPMARSNSSARIKTLNTNTITATAGVGVTSFNLVSGSRNYYDGQSLVSIFHSAAPTVDIKSKFKLNGGQTDSYYGLASITWIDAGAIPTTGTFTVSFTSFDHSNDSLGTGYFTVDSYTNVGYTEIPVYNSATLGTSYNLRDVIDFRPTISDTIGDSTMKNQGLPIPYGASATFTTDYEYYLSRKDKVILTKDKQFLVVAGIPDLQPNYPSMLADAMQLWGITVPAYTPTVANINSEYVENRRYTMRDIGKIDKRVERVEYYTALTLLEKQAKDSALLTSTGVNAFKNGILVDSFNGHSVGDVSNVEYKCSIDMNQRTLRPKAKVKNVQFNRVSGGTLSTGRVVSLPYTPITFIDQPLASGFENVTPFDVANWIGDVKLNPSSDIWYDVDQTPIIISNLNGVNDNYAILGTNAAGTIWGEWSRRWTASGFGAETWISTRAENNNLVTTTTVTSTLDRTGLVPVSISSNAGLDANGNMIIRDIVPYMRQKTISFEVNGMKPFTRIYAYFDNRQVNGSTVMTTDSLGGYTGTFTIPSGVPSGTKTFMVCDTLNNVGSTTIATKPFTSMGTLDHLGGVFLRVIDTKQISTVTSTTSAITPTTRIDPLAQSFFVNSAEFPNGMFLDSIDLYFLSKSDTVPVMMEIRKMENGTPTENIIPFSSVSLSPSSVNIVANRYNPLPSDKTNFKFEAPVYLPAGEYCFVVLSTTTEYRVFTATIGAKQLGSKNTITKQPYIGSMFKSQNASTWTPTQETDLMFRINKCQFDTSNPVNVYLSNIVDSDNSVMPYHVSNVFKSVQEFSSARTQWAYRGVVSGGTLESSYTTINYGTDINLTKEYQINSSLTNQLQYQVTLTSNDANISPMIDLDRASSVVVQNIVNNDLTDETLPAVGLAKAKYMHRRVALAGGFESTGLSVTFDAILPSIADVYVYYKAINTGTNTNFDSANWVLMGNTGNASQIAIDRKDSSAQYTEYTLKTTTTLPLFNLYSVKLVMVGNGLDFPIIKDLRVIAFS